MNCVIFRPLPPAALLLICIMQLEAHGWFVYFYCGDMDAVWRRGWRFRKTQKEVRRRVFAAVLFRQELFSFAFGLCGCVGCPTLLENILLGLCVSPGTLSPSLMLISHRGQPLPAGL